MIFREYGHHTEKTLCRHIELERDEAGAFVMSQRRRLTAAL